MDPHNCSKNQEDDDFDMISAPLPEQRWEVETDLIYSGSYVINRLFLHIKPQRGTRFICSEKQEQFLLNFVFSIRTEKKKAVYLHKTTQYLMQEIETFEKNINERRKITFLA